MCVQASSVASFLSWARESTGVRPPPHHPMSSIETAAPPANPSPGPHHHFREEMRVDRLHSSTLTVIGARATVASTWISSSLWGFFLRKMKGE